MLIDLLHQQFSNLGDLRMREIRVDKQQHKVFCTLSYPASPYFDNDAKTQITDFVRNRMPKGYLCSVKFAEDVFTVNSFIRNLSDYIKEYYPVFSNIGKQRMEVRIDGKQIYASLKVDGVTRKNMELTDFCQKLSEHYAEYTSYTAEFALISDEGNITANVSEQEKLVRLAINRELLRPTRFFNISGQRTLFGKNIAAMPMYISDLRKPMDSCNSSFVCLFLYIDRRHGRQSALRAFCANADNGRRDHNERNGARRGRGKDPFRETFLGKR